MGCYFLFLFFLVVLVAREGEGGARSEEGEVAF